MQVEINPEQTFAMLKNKDVSFFDVRSPGEFQKGAIPGFHNCPILNDQERATVGTTYKQCGRDKAIALGHQLVGPKKEAHLDNWLSNVNKSIVITCWRGGLRSRIAAEWISQRGFQAYRVFGGYKNLRHFLLARIASPPPLLVVSGLTGSGKTELLDQAQLPTLDLERIARHRGSTFGAIDNQSQPSQASFENEIGLQIIQHPSRLLIEDESRQIGRLIQPISIKQKMQTSPVILIKSSTSERCQRIWRDYVDKPLASGVSTSQLKDKLLGNLKFLDRKLGGLRYRQAKQEVEKSLQAENCWQNHRSWIELLLTQHYDPNYRRAFERLDRPVVFKGSMRECLEWLKENKVKYFSVGG